MIGLFKDAAEVAAAPAQDSKAPGRFLLPRIQMVMVLLHRLTEFSLAVQILILLMVLT